MCQELSGLIINIPGEGLRHVPGENTRHHNIMIAAIGLREGYGANGQNFVRYEASPKNGDWMTLDIKIDETRIPSWCDASALAQITDMVNKWRDSMLLKPDTPACLGGKHIAVGKVKIGVADHCKILVSSGAQVNVAIAGDVVEFGDLYSNAQIKTGDLASNAQIKTGYLDSNAQINTGYLASNAQIKTGDLYGNAQIKTGYLASNAQINTGKKL
jgi:hypothetical protein